MEEKANSFWQKKPWQAFKNFAIIFSFVVNFVLVIVLLLALPLLLPIVNGGVKPIVEGLNQSFVEMNQASIKRTIEVSEDVPIDFDLPLYTPTTVTLTQDIPLQVNASFFLPGGGGTINGTVSLVLPTGLPLPIELGLDVPVENQIPVNLNVAVDIPLNETELSVPFTRLENLFGPLVDQLDRLPGGDSTLQPE